MSDTLNSRCSLVLLDEAAIQVRHRLILECRTQDVVLAGLLRSARNRYHAIVVDPHLRPEIPGGIGQSLRESHGIVAVYGAGAQLQGAKFGALDLAHHLIYSPPANTIVLAPECLSVLDQHLSDPGVMTVFALNLRARVGELSERIRDEAMSRARWAERGDDFLRCLDEQARVLGAIAKLDAGAFNFTSAAFLDLQQFVPAAPRAVLDRILDLANSRSTASASDEVRMLAAQIGLGLRIPGRGKRLADRQVLDALHPHLHSLPGHLQAQSIDKPVPTTATGATLGWYAPAGWSVRAPAPEPEVENSMSAEEDFSL